MHNTKAGGNRASIQGCGLQVKALWNRSEPVLGNNRILVKRGHPAGIQALALPLINRGCRLNSGALSPVQHNMVAGLNNSNARPACLNNCTALVPEEVRQKLVRTFYAIYLVKLRAAHAAVMHPNKNLPVAKG